MHKPWTETEKAHLAALWHTGVNLKNHLHEFNGRSYTALMMQAYQSLNLGHRTNTARGAPVATHTQLLELLFKLGSATRDELETHAKVSHTTIVRFIKACNPGVQGMIHIAGWRRCATGGKPIAVFVHGPGKNSAQISRYAGEVRNARHRAKRATARNVFAVAAGDVAPTNDTMGAIHRLYDEEISDV